MCLIRGRESTPENLGSFGTFPDSGSQGEWGQVTRLGRNKSVLPGFGPSDSPWPGAIHVCELAAFSEWPADRFCSLS